MVNPLRVPIVLIVVLCLMLYYVHTHHRQHQTERDPVSSTGQARLQLRQAEDEPRAPDVHGKVSADAMAEDILSNRHATPRSSAARPGQPLLSPPPRNADPPPSVVRLGDPVEHTGEMANVPVSPPRRATLGPTASPQQIDGNEGVARHAASPPSPVLTRSVAGHSGPGHVIIMHRIVDGDTLPRLADRYLGDESRYLEILNANRDVLVQPDLLPLGVRLRIPKR